MPWAYRWSLKAGRRWQLHSINEIMNTMAHGWASFSNPRMFEGYGRQRGWARVRSGNEAPGNEGDWTEEALQLELPEGW